MCVWEPPHSGLRITPTHRNQRRDMHFQNQKAFYQCPAFQQQPSRNPVETRQAGCPQPPSSPATRLGCSSLAKHSTPLPRNGVGGPAHLREGTRRHCTQSDVACSLSEASKAQANDKRKKISKSLVSQNSPTPVLTRRGGEEAGRNH